MVDLSWWIEDLLLLVVSHILLAEDDSFVVRQVLILDLIVYNQLQLLFSNVFVDNLALEVAAVDALV